MEANGLKYHVTLGITNTKKEKVVGSGLPFIPNAMEEAHVHNGESLDHSQK